MLSAWQRRALLYKTIAAIPKGDVLLATIRNRVGGLKQFSLNKRFSAVLEMLEMLKNSDETVSGKHIVEIGTGWHPYLAALFYCMGAAKITLTDIAAHVQQPYVKQTIDYLKVNVERISQLTDLSTESLHIRLAELNPGQNNWQDVWKERGITYLAPFDFTNTRWASAAVDMIYSNSCLGYVPEPILQQICHESQRILKRSGWVMHNITIYDDYSSSDPSITPVNFLRYNERTWSLLGNSKLHFQNRLRPKVYVALFEKSGFRPYYCARKLLELKPETINKSMFSPEFQSLPDEELLCSHFLFVGKKL
jgi:hypothetical protein